MADEMGKSGKSGKLHLLRTRDVLPAEGTRSAATLVHSPTNLGAYLRHWPAAAGDWKSHEACHQPCGLTTPYPPSGWLPLGLAGQTE